MAIFAKKKHPLSYIGKIEVVKAFKTVRIHLTGLDIQSRNWQKKAKIIQDTVVGILRRDPSIKGSKAKITLVNELNEIQIDMWEADPESFRRVAEHVRKLYNNALSTRHHELLRFADFEDFNFRHIKDGSKHTLSFDLPILPAITLLQGDDALKELQGLIGALLKERLPEAMVGLNETGLQPVLQIQLPWGKQSGNEHDMFKRITYILGEDPPNLRAIRPGGFS